MLDCADLLIWLDLRWAECSRSLKECEEARHPSPTLEQRWAFEVLMLYALAYGVRTKGVSLMGHQRLFETFTGTKRRFESRAQANGHFGSFEPPSIQVY